MQTGWVPGNPVQVRCLFCHCGSDDPIRSPNRCSIFKHAVIFVMVRAARSDRYWGSDRDDSWVSHTHGELGRPWSSRTHDVGCLPVSVSQLFCSYSLRNNGQSTLAPLCKTNTINNTVRIRPFAVTFLKMGLITKRLTLIFMSTSIKNWKRLVVMHNPNTFWYEYYIQYHTNI